ncbi:MAG: hypothetical protein GX444_16150 [Myxococcales bacterium]|nr:hypothetical protein [Myxococcales bacterium]
MESKTLRTLLVVMIALLCANLVFMAMDRLAPPREARADIVAGKNFFSTSSPDGRVVYLWQYWTSSEVGVSASAQIKYYGMISAGGPWEPAR